ncbi:hypothetical protein ACF1BE_16160 [Streptomyces sp. NPDC014991]|uniref:hypothetical protein n=1 Tax=Streptomyces sp. NPDC014991 TaxID=3364935 RepID=UPI0036F98CB0
MFALTPAVGYAADEAPAESSSTVTPAAESDIDQSGDEVDTSTDEPSGLVSIFPDNCEHDGSTDVPWMRCTKLDNGRLFHGKKTYDTETRAVTFYQKTGGGTATLRLGYSANGHEHWSGYFTQKKGQTKTKSWPFGARNQECKSSIGLLQEKGGNKVQTPIQKC